MRKFAPIFFILVLLGVSLACSSTTKYTPTPTPVSALAQGMTMVSDKLNAEATQQKFDSIIAITQQVEAATATQQAAFVQSTQIQQARMDAQATAAKQDAEAQATANQARRDAQATQQRIDGESTQQAINIQATQSRLDLEATQSQSRLDLAATQQAGGTATAGSMTMTAIPPAATLTAIANVQAVRLATNQVELSDLEVARARHTNDLRAFLPWLLGTALAIVLAYVLINKSHMQIFKDANGDEKGFAFKGQKVVIFGLLPKPVYDLKSGEMPDVTDPADQFEIVKMNHAVRALEAMPVNPTEAAAQTFNKYFGAQPQNDLPFDVVDADEVPPVGLLDDQALQTLKKDWKEAKDAE